jgi:hypothetical protein
MKTKKGGVTNGKFTTDYKGMPISVRDPRLDNSLGV